MMEYCGRLRREEVPLLSLKGVLCFWGETFRHKTPHIMRTLKRRFKVDTGYSWHLLPIVDVTSTEIPIRY